MPTTRLYKVETKIGRKKQTFLAEATSQEQAIRLAVDPLVKACTIPSPIETARLIGEGVQILTKANAQEVVNAAVEGAQGELETAPKRIEAVAWPLNQVLVSKGPEEESWQVTSPWSDPRVFTGPEAQGKAVAEQAALREQGPPKEWLESLPREAQPVEPVDAEIPPAGQHD